MKITSLSYPYLSVYHRSLIYLSRIISLFKITLIKIKLDDITIIFGVDNYRDFQRAITIKFKEEGTFKFITKNVKPNDVFLDVGANIGVYSILAAAKLGLAGKVVSIEPHSINFSSLLKNIALNNKSATIYPLNIALTSKRSFQPFNYYQLDSGSTGSQLGKSGYDNFHFREKVTEIKFATSIDELVDTDIIPVPTLIKIDVDGLEYQIVQGMVSLLKSEKRPRLVQIEINLEYKNEIIGLMSECGYKLREKHYTYRCSLLISSGIDPDTLPFNAIFG